jgi:hypothetical protein
LPLLRAALREIETQDEKQKVPQGLKPVEGGALMSDLKVRPPRGQVTEMTRSRALILESNSLMQFLKPSLYFAVIDPLKDDFKESAQMALDRAHALVLRGNIGGDGPPAPLWMKLPAQLMKEKPSVLQREGEELPEPLWALVHRMLEGPPGVAV